MNILLYPLFVLLISISALNAQVPPLLEYDGYLEETIWTTSITSTTAPVTGTRSIGVKLYNASENGTLLYQESIGSVMVTNGQLYFQYGWNGTAGNSATPALIGSTLTGSQNWLAITVNGTEQKPRERLLSVPFALRSGDAEQIDSKLIQTQNDLKNVVSAVGKVVDLFGGNSTNLVSNPTGTISTIQNTVQDLMEIRSKFRVVSLSGNMSFGSSLVGVPVKRPLTITNNGFYKLSVRGITYPAGFSGGMFGGEIAPGGSQTVNVTFSAGEAKSYGGNITIDSNATAGVGSIGCTGAGIAKTRIIALSGNLVFAPVSVGANATRIFGIKNNGNDNLTISGITCPAGFSGNWSGTIAPGATQNVALIFKPAAALNYGGNLSVASNATDGSGVLPVSGCGVMPMITVKGGTLPSSSQFAGQVVSTFQIGKYEVTWEEWKNVRDWAVANGYTDLSGVGGTYPDGSAGNFPVLYVSWYDVVKWCNAKSEKEGLTPVYQVSGATYKTGQSAPTVNSLANGYRLPSDKEREWASRGGLSSKGYTFSGSNDLALVAWFTGNSGSASHAIGTKVANELGIYDMSGNVWEWCWDWDGMLLGSRLINGGGWETNFITSAFVGKLNFSSAPDHRGNEVGIRLARSSGI